MRDGIWKTLELPKAWRRVARLCEREATRGDAARKAALRALVQDLKRQLNPRLLRELQQLGEFLPFNHEGLIGDTLEHELLAAVRHFRQSDPTPGGLERALAHVIQEHLAKYIRQCTERYASDPDPTALDTAKAFADTAAALPIDEIARALIAGEEIPVDPVHSEIDIDDDDLSRPQ